MAWNRIRADFPPFFYLGVRLDCDAVAMADDYQDCLDYLYGRLNYERVGMPRSSTELRLGRMRRLLRELGDPQQGLRIIHVAGTKGKGSTSAMLAASLTAAGVKTALFSSPHLHRLEERYRIDGAEISKSELVSLVDLVRPVVDRLDDEDTRYALRGATFFEITTALGLLHFARQGVGAVVLEVGMGGRLDSTNVIRPAVSVITSISFDHTKQLGNTLGAIAREKAGIIKRGRPTVSGVRGDEPRGSIRQVARLRRSSLYEIDHEFTCVYEPPAQPLTGPTAGTIEVKTWRQEWPRLTLPLLGAHQAQNAAVALASLDVLAEQGLVVTPEAVARGFATLNWPARVEILGSAPWVVVDGAHNVASAEALAATLVESFPRVPLTLVFGTTREKDLVGQLKALLPLASVVVATQYIENPRAVPPEEVVEAIRQLNGPEVQVAREPAEAIEQARRLTPSHGLICITGSLFLAAETRAILLSRTNQSALISASTS